MVKTFARFEPIRAMKIVSHRVQGWPYPPMTFFYRDNRSSGVSSLFSAVLGRHSCTKYMGMSLVQGQRKEQKKSSEGLVNHDCVCVRLTMYMYFGSVPKM